MSEGCSGNKLRIMQGMEGEKLAGDPLQRTGTKIGPEKKMNLRQGQVMSYQLMFLQT